MVAAVLCVVSVGNIRYILCAWQVLKCDLVRFFRRFDEYDVAVGVVILDFGIWFDLLPGGGGRRSLGCMLHWCLGCKSGVFVLPRWFEVFVARNW